MRTACVGHDDSAGGAQRQRLERTLSFGENHVSEMRYLEQYDNNRNDHNRMQKAINKICVVRKTEANIRTRAI